VSGCVREDRRTPHRDLTVDLDSTARTPVEEPVMSTNRLPSNPPLADQLTELTVKTGSIVRRITRSIVLTAAREARDTAFSTLIGGVIAWWLGHR